MGSCNQMWSEKGIDNSRSFLNMPWAQLTYNQTGNELEVFGQHLLLVHSTTSLWLFFWAAHNTHTPVGSAQHSFTVAFFLSTQHLHSCGCTAQLHLPSEHTTPTLLWVHSIASLWPSFWAHNTHTLYCMCSQATQHPQYYPTSFCWGLRFVCNGLQHFYITCRV